METTETEPAPTTPRVVKVTVNMEDYKFLSGLERKAKDKGVINELPDNVRNYFLLLERRVMELEMSQKVFAKQAGILHRLHEPIKESISGRPHKTCDARGDKCSSSCSSSSNDEEEHMAIVVTKLDKVLSRLDDIEESIKYPKQNA